MTEPKKQEEVYTIGIPQSHLDILGQLLAKASYEVSAPILSNIQNQLNKIESDKKKTKKPGKSGKA